MDRKWAIVALLMAFAPGCMGDGETVEASDEDTESTPDRTAPAVPPDREPERDECAPLMYEMADGLVIPIPVECQIIPVDRGDPPNEAPAKQEKEMVENPATQGIDV
jgi:hypothetical protein